MHSSRRIPTLNQPWRTIRGISRLSLHAPANNFFRPSSPRLIGIVTQGQIVKADVTLSNALAFGGIGQIDTMARLLRNPPYR